MSGGSRGRSPGINNWWNSRGTPKNPNPFHKGIQSESKPPGPKPPINQYMYIYIYIYIWWKECKSIHKNTEKLHWTSPYHLISILTNHFLMIYQNHPKPIKICDVLDHQHPEVKHLWHESSCPACPQSRCISISCGQKLVLISPRITVQGTNISPQKKPFILKMIFQTSLRWDP